MRHQSLHTHLFLLICTGLLLYCCHNTVYNSNPDTLKQIDSLISVNPIRAHVILINFGADAITAVRTQTGIVVIDAGISAGLTEIFRKRIEQQFPDIPFTYVLNTHAHHDHYRGNSVFSEARIVAHENSMQEMGKEWENPVVKAQNLKKIADEYTQMLTASEPNTSEWKENYTQKIRYEYACWDILNKVPFKLTDMVFKDSLSINTGAITFEMKYFGKCHSNSDILIFCPELNMLFTGDLFSTYGRISYNYNEPDEAHWMQALDWLNKRKPHISLIIGGHGQIMQLEDLEAFEKNIKGKGFGM